ncbi:hypothetical protein BV898_03275 [Hypsibius exemplaris]|uniref:Uncharacterized protein n=1 Tax=Hypsibius exemplaris TaxID=2072580 RepID=A0A1W0X693_HYPEX|nr:hypothetical protein BV898_03275 [Hypsibius exemplaris]
MRKLKNSAGVLAELFSFANGKELLAVRVCEKSLLVSRDNKKTAKAAIAEEAVDWLFTVLRDFDLSEKVVQG